MLEFDGGAGHKKPPRKERKKLLSTQACILLFVTCNSLAYCLVEVCFFHNREKFVSSGSRLSITSFTVQSILIDD